MDTYNDYVRAINGSLQTMKRAGASYEPVLGRIDAVAQKLEKVLFHHNQQKAELVKEKQKHDTYLTNLKTNADLNAEKVKRATESVESFSNMAKMTLNNTKFGRLKDVKEGPEIESLFRFLYANLYSEPEETFEMAKFKRVALKEDLSDFQKRLALFSVMRLDAKQRDRLNEIKTADYAAYQDNEDLYNLLAWLEFNHEAFVALKEKEQAATMIADLKNKEKKHLGNNANTKRLIDDLDDIIHYCEASLEHVRLYQKKLSEANELYKRTAGHQRVAENMAKVFAAVDGFKGNDVVERLDLEMGS